MLYKVMSRDIERCFCMYEFVLRRQKRKFFLHGIDTEDVEFRYIVIIPTAENHTACLANHSHEQQII